MKFNMGGFFSKICRRGQSLLKSDKKNGYFRGRVLYRKGTLQEGYVTGRILYRKCSLQEGFFT
jgi:hypothetical protein